MYLSSLIACKLLEGRDYDLLDLIELNGVKTALKYMLKKKKYWEPFWPAMSFGIWRATRDGKVQPDILFDFL